MSDHQIKIGDEILTVAQLSTAQIRRLISGIVQKTDKALRAAMMPA